MYFLSQGAQSCSPMERALQIKSIERSASGTVRAPIGKAERLRHSRFGLSSVRIDAVNRLVYKIEDGALLIVSCKGHYQQ